MTQRRPERQLWRADRRQDLLADARPSKAGRRPRIRRTFTIVGKSVPRLDIPDKVTGTFTYMQDFRVPGMLHARVVRPPAIGATLESVDDGVGQRHSRRRQGRARRQFPRRRRRDRMGARSRRRSKLKATWSDWEGLPEQAKLWEHVRATKVAKDEVTSQRRQRRRRHGQGRREETQRHLRLRHPHARLDRPVLRDRRVQGRQAHLAGRRRRRRTTCASSSRRCSSCRPRTCAASTSRAPAATAATGTRTPPPMRRCSPRPSAGRCACNGRAPTSTAGIRKARRR